MSPEKVLEIITNADTSGAEAKLAELDLRFDAERERRVEQRREEETEDYYREREQ